MTGTRDGELAIPGVQLADLAGGSLLALTSLLAAVIQREHTGQGQLVDISMFHGALSLATMVLAGVETGLEKPEAGKMMLNGRYPCYGLYKTKDDRYMSLGALEFKFWANFCTAVARADLVGGQFGSGETTAEVAKIFAERTQAEWIDIFKDHDACCEPVLSLGEALASELVLAKNMVDVFQDGRRFLGSPLIPYRRNASREQPSPATGPGYETDPGRVRVDRRGIGRVGL